MSIDRDIEDYDDGNLSWFQENMKKYIIYKDTNLLNNIIKSFLFSNYNNLFVLDDTLSLSSETEFMSISTRKKYQIDNLFSKKSLSSIQYPSRIIFGYQTNNMINNIQFASNINLKWLPELFPHIFNPSNLNYGVYNSFEDYMKNKNKKRNSEFNKKIKYFLRGYFKTDYLRNMSSGEKTPVINHFVKDLIKKLK